MIHIFFDDLDPKHGQQEVILRSIIKQAIEQRSEVPEEILNIDDEMQDDLEEMYGEFAEASRAILHRFDRVFLVIDGFKGNPGTEDVEWLRNVTSSSSNLSIILSSTQSHLDYDLFDHQEVRVIDLDQRAEVEEDIKRYVTEQLENDTSLCKWSVDIQKEMKDCLVEGACGT